MTSLPSPAPFYQSLLLSVDISRETTRCSVIGVKEKEEIKDPHFQESLRSGKSESTKQQEDKDMLHWS